MRQPILALAFPHSYGLPRSLRSFAMTGGVNMSICNSAPSEYLAIVALRHGDRLLERNRGIIRENLGLADAFFGRCGGLFANHSPQCGPVAFHKMNTDIDMEEFCEELVRKSGVLLLPSAIYEYPGPYFRMGYGRRNFAESLCKFEEHLTALSRPERCFQARELSNM